MFTRFVQERCRRERSGAVPNLQFMSGSGITMKNIMKVFVVLVIFLGAMSVSEANPLPDSEASWGGITLGGSREYVKGI